MKYILSVLVFLMITVTLQAQQAVISIETNKPGAKINPNMYGIFFEDINHAVEGGMYAEMIRNRDFESARLPEAAHFINPNTIASDRGWIVPYEVPDPLTGWKLISSEGAQAKIERVLTMPLNSTNPANLKMTISKLDGGKAGVYNAGYWGMSVIKGSRYNLSFYAHCNSKYKGVVGVSFVSQGGEKYASKTIAGIGPVWKKFTCTFTSNGTDRNARFVINGLSVGSVYFDIVSLFPSDTYKHTSLRKDIAEKIEAVKPGFLRFPGGCIVEGYDLDNRIKWKNTIGNVAKRPGHWDLWGYHTTDGIGFHEYLQFCENVGAQAMYVFPVAMSCEFRKCEYIPVDSLKPYLKDVMDALEYAMGPATSKWGAQRAKNGHPLPFKIKYVEVGNENYGPIYQDRYQYFYDAIKAKYPDITPITCTDPSMRSAFKKEDLSDIHAKIEMIDEHFYESPDFFYKNVNRYDNYDRKGPKIYVGEFAVKKWDNSLKGNLEGALAEAAFYTGLERNADLVKLASLAPTLVNDSDRTWNPDLITFNNKASFAIPSYYAIKMFKTNLADRVLPTKVNYDLKPINDDDKGKGILAFTNPAANCIYKDFKLTIDDKTFQGKELFASQSWAQSNNGAFSVGTTDFKKADYSPEVNLYGDAHQWRNYTLNLKAYADKINDLEGFDIWFWSTGNNKHWNFDIGRWRRMYWLEWYDKGYESYFGEARGDISEKKWYDVTIKVTADSVFTYLDGKAIHAVKKPEMITPGLYASAGEKNNGKQIIIKVVNATPEGQTTAIDLHGAKNLRSTGEAVTMSSGSKLDENSFTDPDKVAPTSKVIKGVSAKFSYTFPANSITILKLSRQ